MLVANATRHDKQRYIRDAWISDANVHVQRILRVVPTTVLRSIPSRLHGSMSRKLVPAKELRHYPHCTLLSHSESSINFIYWSTNIYADFHHTRRQPISSVNCLCLADHISVFLMKTMFFYSQTRNETTFRGSLKFYESVRHSIGYFESHHENSKVQVFAEYVIMTMMWWFVTIIIVQVSSLHVECE